MWKTFQFWNFEQHNSASFILKNFMTYNDRGADKVKTYICRARSSF